MGNAAATPSGANIGQLDISTLLPSTGMGINADGSGTATVGTLDTTGNIIGSSADTLNMFDTGMGNTSTIDPNFIGLSGTGGTTGGTTGGNVTGGNVTGGNVTGGNVTTVVPPVVVPPVVVPPALSQAQVIQNLFNTSQTKDIAAQRIGDYAASVGGITAENIAAAVTPILSGQMESPNTFGMAPVGADGTEQVMQAVQDFGYGQLTGGPDVASFITENPMIASTAQPVELSPAEQLAENNARLQYLTSRCCHRHRRIHRTRGRDAWAGLCETSGHDLGPSRCRLWLGRSRCKNKSGRIGHKPCVVRL
jgi:hypothetical protein